MIFKHKDLTINLAQPEGPFADRTGGCPPGGSRVIATPGFPGCAFNSYGNGFQLDPTLRFGTPENQVNTLSWGSPEESLNALSTLKGQLQQQLVEIEKQQTELGDRLKPQTVEQVDALSAQLTDALASLKTHRAELTKAGKAAPAVPKKSTKKAAKKGSPTTPTK